MRPLHGSDVFHLREEQRGRPAHTLKVAVLAPGAGPLDADELAHWAAGTLRGRAPFRWRLSTGPAHLGRPVWVDPETAFDTLLGDLAGDELPRQRPLWRLWVVDGLADDQVALVLQMHHALADGAASVQIWEELFDGTDPDAAPPTDECPAPDLGAAVRRHGRLLRDLPALLARLRAHGDAEKAQPEGPGRTATYFEAPPLAFNRLPSGTRICTFATLPLAGLKQVGAQLGGTVNDVYAALCAGALRAYLLERGGLPEASLTATTPVGLDRQGRPYGNAMTTWFVRLGTDEADPRARFAAVRASLAAARSLQERDPTLLHDLQEHTRLYDLIWRSLGLAERRKGRPTFNLVISNVRGPDPLAWRGHPVVALRSLGPLAGRMGLNLTAWSYGADFTIGLHACRDQLPDLFRLAELLVAELDVLIAAGECEG
jgi:diacylglycerol O-acyltransferase